MSTESRVRRIAATATAIMVGIVVVTSHAGNAIADDKPAAKTKAVEAGDLKLTGPGTRKQEPARTGPRVAELTVPPVGDDKEPAEFAVFYFGKQGAGGVSENVDRWIKQVDPEGRKVKTVTGECPDGKYTLVDVTGTYNK